MANFFQVLKLCFEEVAKSYNGSVFSLLKFICCIPPHFATEKEFVYSVIFEHSFDGKAAQTPCQFNCSLIWNFSRSFCNYEIQSCQIRDVLST